MALRGYKFELFDDRAGEHRWRMVAPNGQIIATSGEGYKNAGDCALELHTIITVIKADEWEFGDTEVTAKDDDAPE